MLLPMLLPLTAQAMSMWEDVAQAQALVVITPRISLIRPAVSNRLWGTTSHRGIILMLLALLLSTAQEMSMSRDRAWAQAVFITIIPPLSMTRPATSSGLPRYNGPGN